MFTKAATQRATMNVTSIRIVWALANSRRTIPKHAVATTLHRLEAEQGIGTKITDDGQLGAPDGEDDDHQALKEQRLIHVESLFGGPQRVVVDRIRSDPPVIRATCGVGAQPVVHAQVETIPVAFLGAAITTPPS